VGVVVVPRAASATACRSAVSLRGEPHEVQQLSRSLERYDEGGDPAASCRSWSVTIWRSGAQVTIELADGQGLTIVRQVSDVRVAAAVVDSWLHEEDVPAAAPPVAVVESTASVPPARTRDAVSLAVGPEAVAASDGTAWLGGQASACVAVGRFCAGAIAQGAVGRSIVGDPGTTRRFSGTLLAALHLPIALGAVTFIPGVGLGAGFTQVNTSDAAPADPTEPTGARRATDWDVIGSARAVLAIPLVGRLGVDVGGAFDLSLVPHALDTDGQGGAYPRDPRFFLRGGVALRYGRP